MSITIMIIDDDADDSDLFCEAVSQIDASMHCLVASGADEAFLLLNDDEIPKPDFIFLDLNMPRVSGKQCLKLLKKKPEFKNIPVIIYSTAKMDGDVDEVKRDGAVSFLTKPAKQADLIKAIKLILNGKYEMVETVSRY